ncbi:hypothetical protein [Longibacter sp.]|uniref:hypothetical protein n=1 Tax=Longibacter sp. TaxID=2045415 RepID=UPI003EC122A9
MLPRPRPPFLPRLVAHLLLFSLALSMIGCDTSVQPYKDSAQHFSLFGRIDVTSTEDSSLVRVSRLRDGVPGAANPDDELWARLTEAETGAETTLPVRLDSVEDRDVFNISVPNGLPFDTEYTLSVEEQRSGQTARTTFRTPVGPPIVEAPDTVATCLDSEVGSQQPRPFRVRVNTRGTDELSELRVVYFAIGERFTIRTLKRVYQQQDVTDSVDVIIRPQLDLACVQYRSINGCPEGRPAPIPDLILLELASSNEGWPGPTYVSGSREVRASPGLSTVEKGFGAVFSSAHTSRILGVGGQTPTCDVIEP